MSKTYIDFETFYSKDYSLSKMTTREYVMDPRFKATMLSVAINDCAPFLLVGDDIRDWVESYDWASTAVIAHNVKFDGAVLMWHYGIKPPRLWYCTMGLAAMTVGHRIGGTGLDKVVRALGLPDKDKGALEAVQGVDVLSMDRGGAAFKRLAAYAVQDVESCRLIERKLGPMIAPKHKLTIHAVNKMYLEGDMRVDRNMCDDVLVEAKAETSRLLTQCGLTPSDESRAVFRSRDKFAALLASHGVTCPKKISPKTGKETWAQSKKDIEFVKLLDHDDERIRFMVEMRLNAASSIVETRAKKFVALSKIGNGELHAPLLVSGAHTHRFSGTDSLNMQNLPKASMLKKATKAPKGYVFVVVDASQIEARILAWLAGCVEVVEAFANKRDVYAEFASKVFGFQVNKNDHPKERQLGKVGILSLGYATGHETLYKTLLLGGAQDMTLAFAKTIVNTYREGYYQIPALWKRMEHLLGEMVDGRMGQIGPLVGQGEAIWLEDVEGAPNLKIEYPGLRRVTKDGPYGPRAGFEFFRSRFKSFNSVYGGSMTENVVQHMAWTQIVDTVVKIIYYCERMKRDWKWVLQVHDEVVYLVPEDEADEALRVICQFMCEQPNWARWKTYPVPFDAEGEIADRYGDAK